MHTSSASLIFMCTITNVKYIMVISGSLGAINAITIFSWWFVMMFLISLEIKSRLALRFLSYLFRHLLDIYLSIYIHGTEYTKPNLSPWQLCISPGIYLVLSINAYRNEYCCHGSLILIFIFSARKLYPVQTNVCCNTKSAHKELINAVFYLAGNTGLKGMYIKI